jgi:DNA-binding transcriptional ArsR family regulator
VPAGTGRITEVVISEVIRLIRRSGSSFRVLGGGLRGEVADSFLEAGRGRAVRVPVSGEAAVRALTEEYGVSYITVRHAMAVLRERGLIVSIHGRGTFVAASMT